MIEFKTTWEHSCHNEWIQQGNYFEFFLKKGTPGKCIGDADSTRYYKFKERSEVRSTELDQGVYEWSANLEIISDKLFHAKYFSLFQVHGFVNSDAPHYQTINFGKPYSSLGVKHSGFNLSSPNSSKDVPCDLLKYNRKHSINVRVVIGKKKVIVRYKIDDKHVGTTSADKLQSDVKPFLKFGVYRWEANCDVTQIYKDVTLAIFK